MDVPATYETNYFHRLPLIRAVAKYVILVADLFSFFLFVLVLKYGPQKIRKSSKFQISRQTRNLLIRLTLFVVLFLCAVSLLHFVQIWNVKEAFVLLEQSPEGDWITEGMIKECEELRLELLITLPILCLVIAFVSALTLVLPKMDL